MNLAPEEWKAKLSEEEHRVMRESGTERPHKACSMPNGVRDVTIARGAAKPCLKVQRNLMQDAVGRVSIARRQKPTSPKSSTGRTAWSESKCVAQGATATSDTCSPTVQPKQGRVIASTASASPSNLRVEFSPRVHFLREVQTQSAIPASMVHTEMSSAWVMVIPNKSNVVLTRIFSTQKRSNPLNIR